MNLPVVPKKSLGQNFLNSERVLVRIAETTKADKNDTVLEIGPGLGALTAKLLETAGKVVAVEKDDTLYSILSDKFKSEITEKHLNLIHADILDFDPKQLTPSKKPYSVVANIPYNITGLIFRKFLTTEYQPKTMVVLIQKEVATRILAKDNKESLLSLSVKVYGIPKLITHVARGNFNPVPNVDSSVIAITDITKKNFETPIHEELFFKIIHAGFAHKRKVLVKNMIDAGLGDRELIESVLMKRKLSLNVRSEDLTVADWLFITNMLYTMQYGK
jgi:16S rRNA (adenine1518-N6/adenine1519-N6)-dimethyltransferase